MKDRDKGFFSFLTKYNPVANFYQKLLGVSDLVAHGLANGDSEVVPSKLISEEVIPETDGASNNKVIRNVPTELTVDQTAKYGQDSHETESRARPSYSDQLR